MLLLLRDKEGGDAQRETNTSQSIGGEHIVQAFQFSLRHVTHKKKKKKKTPQSCHPCSTKHMSPLGFRISAHSCGSRRILGFSGGHLNSQNNMHSKSNLPHVSSAAILGHL